LRYALSLARICRDPTAERTPPEYCRTVAGAAVELFGPDPADSPAELTPERSGVIARKLLVPTRAARDGWAEERRLDPAHLDRAIRQRSLALALAGGGGTGFVYLGCFSLLEDWGLEPKLIAATSLGAVLAIFRARDQPFHTYELTPILRHLSFRKLFKLFEVKSRYALPGTLRLYLRSALGQYFHQGSPEGHIVHGPPPLSALKIPVVVSVAGIRRGMLPRAPEAYLSLFDPRSLFPPTPHNLQEKVGDLVGAVGELVRQPHRLARVYVGSDPGTEDFDALDAVGFSSSLPGVIHYDVLREDAEAHRRIAALMERRDLGWLADGGLVENCPARAAWLDSHRRAPGLANPFVLALDGFSPKLATPAWLALEQLAYETVRRVLSFASLYVPFPHTLSPFELVPRLEQTVRAIALGRAQLAPHMPFIARMLAPLPPLGESHVAG
jgi:hypothetical protein